MKIVTSTRMLFILLPPSSPRFHLVSMALATFARAARELPKGDSPVFLMTAAETGRGASDSVEVELLVDRRAFLAPGLLTGSGVRSIMDSGSLEPRLVETAANGRLRDGPPRECLPASESIREIKYHK